MKSTIERRAQSVVKSEYHVILYFAGFTEVIRWLADRSTDEKGAGPGSFASLLITFNSDCH